MGFTITFDEARSRLGLVILYKRTIYELLTGSSKAHLNKTNLQTLRINVFNKNNFEKHFNLLSNLLFQVKNSELFRMCADTLLISSTPNIPYRLSKKTVDLVVAIMEVGIDDARKIKYFLEINEKNPGIFKEFPKLYAIISKVSDYSSLDMNTNFMDPAKGWNILIKKGRLVDKAISCKGLF